MTWLEKRNITRNALLKAVRALVAERRHDHISIQEITTSASVATGTFYNYFDSKHDVFVAAADEIRTEITSALDDVRASIKDPAMLVSVTLKYYFQQACENKEWLTFIESVGLDQVLQQPSERRLEDIERGVKAGRFRVDDYVFTQNLVNGMVCHVTRELTAGRIGPRGIEFAIRSVLQMLGLPELVSKSLTQSPLPPVAASKRPSPEGDKREITKMSFYFDNDRKTAENV